MTDSRLIDLRDCKHQRDSAQRDLDAAQTAVTELTIEGDELRRYANRLQAERDQAIAQRDALLSALRDAVTIMHTARKGKWHEHDRALARFDLDHPEALDLLEEA